MTLSIEISCQDIGTFFVAFRVRGEREREGEGGEDKKGGGG